jgi:hypothetical protein
VRAAAWFCAAAIVLAACDQKASELEQQRAASPALANEFDAPASASHVLPAPCVAYLAKADACVAQLGATSDDGAELTRIVDQARREWTTAEDSASISDMCERSLAALANESNESGDTACR